jgi:hypothetical protein
MRDEHGKEPALVKPHRLLGSVLTTAADLTLPVVEAECWEATP